MGRIIALMWALATLVIGYYAISIALGPKADASGWWIVIGFAACTAYCAWRAVGEWQGSDASRHAGVSPALTDETPSGMQETVTAFPKAWRGSTIALETQIAALHAAGLSLAAGRTMDELLVSWSRSDYENDPYNLILFMYGSEVEAEPWGRFFCARGWNFDTECLTDAGDYVQAFQQILRIAGVQDRVTQLSDDFDIDAEHCTIRYSMDGHPKEIRATINNDWADPDAVTAFVRDIEKLSSNDHHFWAADNGQASILFFLTDTEAAGINALRPKILERYVDGLI